MGAEKKKVQSALRLILSATDILHRDLGYDELVEDVKAGASQLENPPPTRSGTYVIGVRETSKELGNCMYECTLNVQCEMEGREVKDLKKEIFYNNAIVNFDSDFLYICLDLVWTQKKSTYSKEIYDCYPKSVNIEKFKKSKTYKFYGYAVTEFKINKLKD